MLRRLKHQKGFSNEKHSPETPPSVEYQSICLSKLRTGAGIPYRYNGGIPVSVCRTQAPCPASDVHSRTPASYTQRGKRDKRRSSTQERRSITPGHHPRPLPKTRHLGSSAFTLLLATASRISFQALARPRASGKKQTNKQDAGWETHHCCCLGGHSHVLCVCVRLCTCVSVCARVCAYTHETDIQGIGCSTERLHFGNRFTSLRSAPKREASDGTFRRIPAARLRNPVTSDDLISGWNKLLSGPG